MISAGQIYKKKVAPFPFQKSLRYKVLRIFDVSVSGNMDIPCVEFCTIGPKNFENYEESYIYSEELFNVFLELDEEMTK